MRKIYLVIFLWTLAVLVGAIAGIFNQLIGLTFLDMILVFAASGVSMIYVAENWNNWK